MNIEMKIIRKVAELDDFIHSIRSDGKTIGLVPTMGALHDGHLSLVKKAVADNDIAIASVFVNPTQFNNPEDLATYPRDEESDFRLLEQAGIAAVFAPAVEEIYPEGKDEHHLFDLGPAAEVMEGKFRPGHFQGVAQIVSKLFRMVLPDHAYFGEKDFQQIAVIRRMSETENIPVDIVACPICREKDGLALSSRNALLGQEERAVAPGIYETLSKSRDYAKDHSIMATHDSVVEAINAIPHCEVEYFEIVDGKTLQPVDDWEDSSDIVGCITVYCGKVRLIDNIRYT